MASEKTNPDLSIIIVSWKVKDKLRENLNAIYNSTQIVFDRQRMSLKTSAVYGEVFVVDNNSQDGTVEMVKEEFLQVKLIANQDNLGFAKANNLAIKQSKGDFILLLNPDMQVMPDTLEKMVKWMRENKQASIAGCHLINEQGKTIKHIRRFPTVWDQLAIVLKLPHIFPGILDKYIQTNFDYTKPAQVDSIRGGFIIINVGALRAMTPYLDERFFLWFEEVDFCKRIKQANGQVWYTPVAKSIDYVGQSFKQLPRGQAQKYFRDSQLKYFKKWQPVWQYWLLKLTWPVGLLITWLGDKLKIKSKAKT